MFRYREFPYEIRSLILDHARATSLDPAGDPLHLVSKQVRKETQAVERYAIGISGWQSTSSHFSLDVYPQHTDFAVQLGPNFPETHIPGYIGFHTNFPEHERFLTKALDELAPFTRRLVLRPESWLYNVIVILEFDGKPQPTVRFIFMSEERDEAGDEYSEVHPKAHWRQSLVSGVDIWRATADPACCKTGYVRLFIEVVKACLPEDLSWVSDARLEKRKERVFRVLWGFMANQVVQ